VKRRAGKFEAKSFPDKIKNESWWARRDGRVAEGARLESVYTLTGIGGSNPSLSASIFNAIHQVRCFGQITSRPCKAAQRQPIINDSRMTKHPVD
jgi:hypothetical protein